MIKIDARGDACPLPVVKAKKAIAELHGPGEVEVLVDNEIAVQNLTKMAQQKGYLPAPKNWPSRNIVSALPSRTCPLRKPLCRAKRNSRQKRKPASRMPAPIQWWSSRPTRWGKGRGAGQDPAQGLRFSLTQQDKLPKTILFYNGGASLTCEGSPMLEDLKHWRLRAWRS